MGTDREFMEYVADQMAGVDDVSYRKMFGEYAVYSRGKVVALVCDNHLFIKPTEAGREFIGEVEEAPPYPGAKPAFLIGGRLEDSDWLSELVRLTARALPTPKPKKKKNNG